MTTHRNILLTLISLTVISIAVPSSALAGSGPLLGGYGGPGEGNQAILGSALLGGGGGNGSSGSSGGSSGSSGSSLDGASSTGPQAGRSEGNASASGSSAHGAIHGEVGRSGHQASGARSGGGKTSGGVAPAYSASSDRANLQSASVASDTLGLSGADLAYILLTLCVLAFTGVLTRRLVRFGGPEGTQ
jgi:hypothetical protein